VIGYTSAARTPSEQIRSVVFIRDIVLGTEKVPLESLAETVAHNKLGILLHEIGHAYDIEHQFNYDHSKPSFDKINGEFFAHKFSFQIAERCNYRTVMNGIVHRMKSDAESENPVYRGASRMMLKYLRPKKV
jgi:hypothetical protein